MICEIVVLFTFSIRYYRGIISVVFKKNVLLTWFDYVEQDLQKKFPPFVAQHQTVDHNVIGHNPTGKLDLL